MDQLRQDLRIALRSLLRTPAFTLIAALTMALGIAGSTSIFAAFDVLLLRPPPFPEGDRLVRLWQMNQSGHLNVPSAGTFVELRRQTPSLQSAFAYDIRRVNLMTPEGPERPQIVGVTDGFLMTLGPRPQLGRDFLPEEQLAGQEARLLLSDGAWTSRFGRSADVLGKSLVLDGKSYQIVGVLPEGFAFPELPDAEGFVPLVLDSKSPGYRSDHSSLRAIGRLARDASLLKLNADLSVVAQRLERDWPKENTRWGALAVDLREDLSAGTRNALRLALAASGLLLLLACANVGGMLLARGAFRRRELAVRAALGGSRARLFRELLTESALLGAIGGALGMLLARWTIDGLVAFLPASTPRLGELHFDARLAALAAIVSIASGLAAGALPALQASAIDLQEAFREAGGQASAGPGRARARSALVVVQIALALVLLASAGLFGRSLQRVLAVPSGLDSRGVVGIWLSFPESKVKSWREWTQLNGRVLERVASIPGVESTTGITGSPFGGTSHYSRFSIEGGPAAEPGHDPGSAVLWVSPSYRQVLRISLVAGRDLTASDTADAPLVILVNETFVRRYFPNQNPLGRRIQIHDVVAEGGERTWAIAGVLADVHQWGLDRGIQPQIFISLQQQGQRWLGLLFRTGLPLSALAAAVRAEILAIDPQQAIGKAWVLDDLAAESLAGRRVQALVFSLAGALGLLLAALGVYGVVAFSVAQRTKEIGIRGALGADRTAIFTLVLFEGVSLVGVGLALGLLASLAASRALQSALYEVRALDPLTYLAASVLLAFVVLGACLVPARRAMRISPMEALKSE